LKSSLRKRSSDQPLVSIITAVFNDVEHITETIQSIINQKYDNIEYIIIDGGSTDGTGKIIEKFNDRIDYWVSEPDQGIYDAWNKGILQAKGEWISFLGSGDLFYNDSIQVYINAIRTEAIKPDFVSSRVRFVNNRRRVVRVWGESFLWSAFKKYMAIAHVGAFHHESLFKKYGLFNSTYRSSGDYEFFMRCGAHLKTVFVDKITADVIVGGISHGYEGLIENYHIQRQYGAGILPAGFRLWLSYAKRFIRPLVYG